jgi:putative ABC transport system ATP-binding protein/lipoprotein-releasing system ATP-binding protein
VAEGPSIEARNLGYSIGDRVILDGVDLLVHGGRSVAVTGPSGSGKTTLLLCLAGILPIATGSVRVNGTDLASLRPNARARLRLREIGIVYQFGELLPELTPAENVALPALLAGERPASAYAAARGLLSDLGLGAIADAGTATLSGGERQRVAVARALIAQPAAVLADEPTGSLDRAGAEAVCDILFELPKRHGCALVVVTHNAEVAARADEMFVLGAESGKLAVTAL